ncbi:MAG: hypothetical protein G01um101448_767 [Parcubacteria group bacterium Gr01-1014_48]|nr:MAG: hypothetical protein Greene041614_925 [Parcubacteria group bacterium Greene0416_14]TSC73455.1 MAG: hypothetical protein G01um101448_767 [Parcubacteria group bacterium Gr01-1014_48]TSD07782.1 MAG: hypothetical protein Greene07144_722 [Parcubacteria group bacterium Greene0714_4]
MDEPKKKLMRLEEFIHDDASSSLLYDFGHFLANYHLNSRLDPMGFVMSCEIALHDLQVGVNGFTQKPIESRLVGYPPMIYTLLRMEIPRIADAIFPTEFAASVKTFIEETRAEMQAKRTSK